MAEGLSIPGKIVLSVMMAGMASVSLSGCGGGGKKSDQPFEGERIPVLAFERQIEPDLRIQDVDVVLPSPYVNPDWPQAGGYPGHAMQHLALSDNPKKIWSTSIGKGSSGRKWLTAMPVVADGRIYAIDTNAVISAFDADNGRRIWDRRIEREGEKKDVSFGGGVSYADGKIFASTGYGVIVALDAGSGREIWREFLTVPLRGAPTVAGGQVYVHTYDNQLYALSEDTGEILWDHVGISEVAGILGSASPAVSGGTVIAAYSSGELVALTVENGRVTWSDALTRRGALTPLASLNDIDGHPVIDRGRVYAASQGGRTVAIDLRTGERLWERNIGSLHTPWVAGDYLFLLTENNELVCLSRTNGRVRWVQQLQNYKDLEDRKGPLQWAGPVVAGDRIIVTSSHGYALSISPYTGEIISGMSLSDKSFLSPIVADGVLYILTNDGDLLALK